MEKARYCQCSQVGRLCVALSCGLSHVDAPPLPVFVGDEPPSEARLFNQDPKGVRLKLIMQEDRDLTYRVQFLELPGSLRHRKVVTGMSADAVGAVIVFDGETLPHHALQALCTAYPEQCSLCRS